MKAPVLTALAVRAFSLFARAGEHDEKAPWTVRVDVQMVSVSQEQGLALLPQLRDPRTIGAAFARLQKIIAAEPAALLAWPHLHTRNGEASWARNDEGEPFQERDMHGIAESFAIRPLGPQLEAEPIVQPGGTSIELNIVARFVRRLGTQIFPNGQSRIGFKYATEQSTFSTSSVRTILRIANGGRFLLGSFFVRSPSPHVELFILHATATRTDFPKPKIPAR